MNYVENPPNPWLTHSTEWIGEPPEAKLEVFASAQLFDWYAEDAKRDYGRTLVRPAGQSSRVIRQPVVASSRVSVAGCNSNRARSSGSLIGSDFLPPRCEISVNSAKSRRSIGLLPSYVSSVPIRPSSSKPEISWQPAQP